MRRLYLIGICSALLTFCNYSRSSQKVADSKQIVAAPEGISFPYRLDHPDAEIKLPAYLQEISGLSYYGDDRLACVQDEKANIYFLNPEAEMDISKHDFGKDGDYEDIAVVDKTVYVLRNDGRIFSVRDFSKDELKVEKYKTPLTGKNNTEGMEYDRLTNSLLIACKESPSIEEKFPYKGYRAVYRFDLETKEIIEEPFILIDLEKLDSCRNLSALSKTSLSMAKKLRLIDSETPFMPSGISIHPIRGEIYLISSVGKLLILIDRQGKILDIHDLDADLFRQPEGICFSPSGDLFISNEGQGGKGYILKFKPITNE